MTTPDEIRSLYVETLARNSYERWRSHHNRAVQEDGDGILVAAFDDVPDGDFPKETHCGSASVAVNALAEAGLLPTQVEEIGAIPVYSDEETIAYWKPGSRRYMTDRREVAE